MAGPGLTVLTPFNFRTVAIESLSAREAISTPFQFRVQLVIQNSQSDVFNQLLDQPITVTLSLGRAGGRTFNGVCTQLTELSRNPGSTTYLAELTPFFWSQTRNRNSRIFQNTSVPDIISRLLVTPTTPIGFELGGTYPARNYCVQYRESDFDFVSRLMEEEGIYYFFRHGTTSHQMIVADQSPAAALGPGPSPVPFGQPGTGFVSSWQKAQQLTAGRATVSDFNFQLSTTNLTASADIVPAVQAGTVTHDLAIGNQGLEQFDFPGGFVKWLDDGNAQNALAQAARVAAVNIDQIAQRALQIHGASSCPGFTPGYRMSLGGHPDADGDYLLESNVHSAVQPAGSPLQYSNTFTCLPISLPYRPAVSRPRPTIPGLQSAVVVGPPGATVYTDKYGRVKVQFFWDRQGKKDANSSCWVRVASTWAGMDAPPIGREVLVAFLDGDPDQPIVIGAAHSPSFPVGP